MSGRADVETKGRGCFNSQRPVSLLETRLSFSSAPSGTYNGLANSANLSIQSQQNPLARGTPGLSLCLRGCDLSNCLDSVRGKQSLPFLLFFPRYAALGISAKTRYPWSCCVSGTCSVLWRQSSSVSADSRRSSMNCRSVTFSVLDQSVCKSLWRGHQTKLKKFLNPEVI